MTWSFFLIVLWLNTGAPELVPETHTAMVTDAVCDDRDAVAEIADMVLNKSPHKAQVRKKDVWCVESDAPASEHIPGKGET